MEEFGIKMHINVYVLFHSTACIHRIISTIPSFRILFAVCYAAGLHKTERDFQIKQQATAEHATYSNCRCECNVIVLFICLGNSINTLCCLYDDDQIGTSLPF